MEIQKTPTKSAGADSQTLPCISDSDNCVGVVNSLIDEYGRPQQVVVEMTREFKLSGKKRLDLEIEQAANQKKNEERNKKLKDLGVTANYKNRLKLRLWEELNQENPLDRRCPYTGESHQLLEAVYG